VRAESVSGEIESSHDNAAQESAGAPVTEVSPPKRLPSPSTEEHERESSEGANE
jgi:hypothetical protein